MTFTFTKNIVSLLPVLAVSSLFTLHYVDAKISSSNRRPQRFLKKGSKSTKSATCDHLTFSDIFVFGDSLSDQGNLASVSPTYPAGSASNGKFTVEYIAEYFGLVVEPSNHLVALGANDPELITGNNYAVVTGEAAPGPFFNTPTQLSAFTLKYPDGAPSDALYIVMVGGNDLLAVYDDKYLYDSNKTDEEFFNEAEMKARALIDFTVKPLMEAGAQNIVVVEPPPIGDIPFVTLNQPEERSVFTAKAVEIFINELSLLLSDDEYSNVIQSSFPDKATFEKLGLQLESPCTIGFVGVKGAIPEIFPLNGGTTVPAIWDATCSLPDASGFVFWDEIHPSDAVHEYTAGQIIDQMCTELHPGKGEKSSKVATKTKKSKGSKGSKESKESKEGKKSNKGAEV